MENRERKKKKRFDVVFFFFFFFKFQRGSETRETKDINACKKSKNLRVWRIAATGCCKALKPLETTLLDRVLTEEFLIL